MLNRYCFENKEKGEVYSMLNHPNRALRKIKLNHYSTYNPLDRKLVSGAHPQGPTGHD